MPVSRSEPPSGPLRGDHEGVSEVIGQVLIFAIVSFLLVGSMLAFNIAQDAARVRVIGLRAESAAARISGVVVQAAFVQERQATTPGASAQVRFLVDLPQQLEGSSYTVSLLRVGDGGCPNPATGVPVATTAAQVMVSVPSSSVCVQSALFSADAPAGIAVCKSNAAGGHVYVRYAVPSPAIAGCTGGGSFLFLESAP